MSKECKFSGYISDEEGIIDGWYCNLKKDWCNHFPSEQYNCKDYIEEKELENKNDKN